jgi:hypothetical protein
MIFTITIDQCVGPSRTTMKYTTSDECMSDKQFEELIKEKSVEMLREVRDASRDKLNDARNQRTTF